MRSIGIPRTKYHFRVLCLKTNIPRYTPRLPNITARKKSIPSEIRSLFLFARHLSSHIMKNATRLVEVKNKNNIDIRSIISALYNPRVVCVAGMLVSGSSRESIF